MSAISSAESRPLAHPRSAVAPLRATWFVYKWELLKLRAQKRTYLGLGAAVLVPIAFVLALIFKSGSPNDIPLGRYLRESGLATPFVVLEFMAIWGLPLITALVAGDIVASESHNGTLKTILSRSRDRGEVFAGKLLATLTYTATAVAVMAGSGLRPRPPSGAGSRSSPSPGRRCPRTTASCSCSPPSASTCSPCSGSPRSGC